MSIKNFKKQAIGLVKHRDLSPGKERIIGTELWRERDVMPSSTTNRLNAFVYTVTDNHMFWRYYIVETAGGKVEVITETLARWDY